MNDTILASLCDALGWKGGTLHAALVEVRRLVQIKAATKAVMDQLSFRAAVGGLKLNDTDRAKLAAVGKLYTPAEKNVSLTPLGEIVLDSEELAQCRSMNNPPQDEGDNPCS